jgi:hypothetical protein
LTTFFGKKKGGVSRTRTAVSPEARVIIETKLGEEAQVNYGTGTMVRDPDSGVEQVGQFR